MSGTAEISRLLRALMHLFAAEGRPGGELVAEAIATELPRLPSFPAVAASPLHDVTLEALLDAHHIMESTIREALPYLEWVFSGYEDGRIRPEIALNMQTAEVIGPDGLIFHSGIRAGLFVQSAGLDYTTRSHAAEETFVMLGGEGWWSQDNGTHERRLPGEYIHHPSNMPHATRTRERPLIAAWRWTGDIGWESYSLA